MNQYPSEQQQIDLSSIQDQGDEKIDSDSLQIQQMGQPFNLHSNDDSDDQQFRNNVRQILMTDQVAGGQEQQSDEYFGQPVKGSFLKDMQILGKTISFDSTWHNIYEDDNSCILQYLQNKNGKDNSCLMQFLKGYKNLEKSNLYIEQKYIIDFRKKNGKVKVKNKQKTKKCRQDEKNSNINSDFQFSVKSINSSCLKKSQQSRQKTGRNFKSNRKGTKEQERRKSQVSLNTKNGRKNQLIDLKKNISSPLRKVGFHTVNQALKTKNSQISSIKEEKKKKIMDRFNGKKKV